VRSVVTSLEHALAYLDRGIGVIPIPRPRVGVAAGSPGDGKTPSIAWKEFQTRLPTVDELRQWFSGEPLNLAIVCGAVSGLVVVDADSPESLKWSTRRLPYTSWQVATARGFHLYYRRPDVTVANRARVETRDGRLALDVRADGGFVIAPPSIHASGALYRFAGDWTVTREQIPRFWPGWLQRPTRHAAPMPIRTRPTGDVVDRARRYLAAIPKPEIGHASDRDVLYAACRLVRGFEMNASDAESLLWEWCGGRPGWTRDWVAQKVTHAIRYGSEPIGAMR
jgi:hypothetical protein